MATVAGDVAYVAGSHQRPQQLFDEEGIAFSQA